MSKIFLVVLIIAAIFGYGTKSWATFLWIVGIYAVIRIIFNLFK